MKNIIRLSSFLFSLFFVIHCSTKNLTPQIVSIESIKLTELNSESLNLTALINIENTNVFGVTVSDINFDILNEGTFLGKTVKKEKVDLPSGEITTVEFDLELEPGRVAEILSKQEDTLKLVLKGSLVAEALVFTLPQEIELPYDFPLKSNLEKLFESESNRGNLVNVEKAELKKLGLTNTTLHIKFTLNNPYNIPLRLIEYPSKIYINDSYSGDGELKKIISLKENEKSKKGVFIFEGDNIRSVLSTLKSIFSRELKYRTEGELELEVLGYKIKIPFTNTGTVVKI